jgi:hypothetical protein
MKAIIIATCLLLTTASHATQTHSHSSCDIHLDKDIRINSHTVAITDAETELWRINHQGQLWLKNQRMATDNATQQKLQQFQSQIRQQSMQALTLVQDALMLASASIHSAVSELTAEPLANSPALEQAVTKINTLSQKLIQQHEDGLTVYGSRLTTVNEVFDQAFEQAIEQAVTQLLGKMLLVVGNTLTSGEGNFEQRMTAFGQKMENFGDQLEQRITSQASSLEFRGQALCNSLINLDVLESEIQQAIPQLKQYDLIDAKADNKT